MNPLIIRSASDVPVLRCTSPTTRSTTKHKSTTVSVFRRRVNYVSVQLLGSIYAHRVGSVHRPHFLFVSLCFRISLISWLFTTSSPDLDRAWPEPGRKIRSPSRKEPGCSIPEIRLTIDKSDSESRRKSICVRGQLFSPA